MRDNDIDKPLAILVSGSRHAVLDDHGQTVLEALEDVIGKRRGVLIVHGAAKGVDGIADYLAYRKGWHTLPMYAQWNGLGPGAGPMRNRGMVRVCAELRHTGWDVEVLAFPAANTRSVGTENLMSEAKSACLPITRVPISVEAK